MFLEVERKYDLKLNFLKKVDAKNVIESGWKAGEDEEKGRRKFC